MIEVNDHQTANLIARELPTLAATVCYILHSFMGTGAPNSRALKLHAGLLLRMLLQEATDVQKACALSEETS